MAARHLKLGRAGEDKAWEYLKQKGFKLLARNWSHKRYELDIVCEDGDTVVFVEVKTRGQGMRGQPSDALTPAKMLKLVKAAAFYLSSEQFWDRPCRFDLLSLSAAPNTETDFYIHHIEDAFDLSQVPGASRFWQP